MLRISIAMLTLAACVGGSIAPASTGGDASTDAGHVGPPSCATTDPCFAEGGACFTCQEGSGLVCYCSDAGPDASPYRSSCIGTEQACTGG
jgi:hypothetical protein